ncbi:MAG: class I SAM-dependent methyltransferase [Bacteroidetes bacterium]|nr:class I SAM-dependent methyltransferase [Bacteroidota bacterium]
MLNYYYSPIPDTTLFSDDFFAKESQLIGFDLNEAKQLELLKKFVGKYRTEYDRFPVKPANYYDFFTIQTSYRCVDAQMLYCFVRELKPKKIIEIGSGYSTMLTAQALRKNKTENAECICDFAAIEPYPNVNIKKGFEGLSRLISLPVEKVPYVEFEELNENDILFIDSSHTVRAGGDVVYEVLELLPRLKKGVYIHIHDIFFPFQYPKVFFDDKRFWAEQYLVQAFLINNDAFEISWTSHYMHRKHTDLLKSSMNYYEPGMLFVSSLWLKKIK